MIQILIIFAILAVFCFIQLEYPFTHRPKSQSISELNACGGGYYLDVQSTNCVKGIAILLILVGHISGTFHTVVFTPLPAAGVSLFLMLSGYGLSESYKIKGLKHFWGKKITRVIVPYAIIITLLVVFKKYDIKLIDYILEITGVKTLYWYIGYQIKWYVVFFITMLFVPNRSLWIFAVVGVFMFITLGSLEIEQSPAFLIGVLASKYKNKLTRFSRRSMIVQFAVFAGIGILFLTIKQLPSVREYLGTPIYSFIQMMHNMAFALCVIAVVSIIPAIRKSSFLVFCGIISYEIYLVHFPFYTNVEGDFLKAISLVAISIMISVLFYTLNGKISSKMGKHLKF